MTSTGIHLVVGGERFAVDGILSLDTPEPSKKLIELANIFPRKKKKRRSLGTTFFGAQEVVLTEKYLEDNPIVKISGIRTVGVFCFLSDVNGVFEMSTCHDQHKKFPVYSYIQGKSFRYRLILIKHMLEFKQHKQHFNYLRVKNTFLRKLAK